MDSFDHSFRILIVRSEINTSGHFYAILKVGGEIGETSENREIQQREEKSGLEEIQGGAGCT